MAILINAIINSDSSNIMSFLINGIVNIIIALFHLVLGIVLSINERTNEYKADNFAHGVGYGEELLKALRLLDKLDMSGNKGILERLKASHPYTDNRIYELERVLG